MPTAHGLHVMVALSAALATGIASGPQAPATGQAPISIAIRAVQPVVRAGSPVIVEEVTRNTSDHGIPDFRGLGNLKTPGLAVEVHDPTGASTPRTEFGRGLIGKADLIPIRTIVGGRDYSPGETWEDTLYINAEYDMSRSGEYTIQLGQRLSKDLVVKSNTITVTVEDTAEYDRRFAQAGPFLLTITTPLETVKVGSEVLLRTYVTNITGSEVTYDCAKFSIHIFDADNNAVDWIASRELLRFQQTGSGKTCGAQPYGSEVDSVSHLNKLYDLGKPDRYTIQASQFYDKGKTWVKSNTLSLTVTP